MASKTYSVVTSLPGYYTSLNAMQGTDKRCTVPAGTYYIFNEANGAINVTTQEGVPGSWINPNNNIAASVDQVQSGDNTSSSSSWSGGTSSTGSSTSGSNKKVYSPTKDSIPCYIINTLTGGSIEFECEPDEISDNNSAKFDSQDVRGRSSPYQGYDNSGPRNINFSVTLHDDLCKNGILTTVNRLKSLTYPQYGEGILQPPKSLIHIGNMIKAYCVINSVGVTWKKPYRDNTYVQAEISIDATEVVETPYSASDIWSKGGYI